jgi:heme oxygenase
MAAYPRKNEISVQAATPIPLVLVALRRATEHDHARLEADLGLVERSLTGERYRRVLEALRGYHAAVEEPLRAIPGVSALALDLDRRRKLALLDRDLGALGLDERALAEIPVASGAAVPRSVGEALGCLYVLEGATLGGQIISRRLAGLGVTQAVGGAYFHGYGPDTGAMWRGLLVALDESSRALDAEQTIVAFARETFAALHGWLREREVLA